jgi:hypothetical protein
MRCASCYAAVHEVIRKLKCTIGFSQTWCEKKFNSLFFLRSFLSYVDEGGTTNLTFDVSEESRISFRTRNFDVYQFLLIYLSLTGVIRKESHCDVTHHLKNLIRKF